MKYCLASIGEAAALFGASGSVADYGPGGAIPGDGDTAQRGPGGHRLAPTIGSLKVSLMRRAQALALAKLGQ